MSSLVERLRARSDRRPIYSIDESDDDDFVPRKPGVTLDKLEKIVRDDAVCISILFFFFHFSFLHDCSMFSSMHLLYT